MFRRGRGRQFPFGSTEVILRGFIPEELRSFIPEEEYNLRSTSQEFFRLHNPTGVLQNVQINLISNNIHRFNSRRSARSERLNNDSSTQDLSFKIAKEIANIYYINLELTLEDVQGVITKHLKDLNEINYNFIKKIERAVIDEERKLTLITILSDKNIIKTAVLQIYKDKICKIFNQYISWWKLSWFGHHHDKRARIVKAQIQNCQSIDEIKSILQRQEIIMTQKNAEQLPNTSWQDNRWNERATLKNTPTHPKTSGYYKVITEALELTSPRPRM